MIKNVDTVTTIETLKEKMRDVVQERQWQQFHTPKNLASKLIIESGELLEKFVWIDNEQSYEEIQQNRQEIEDEVADVFMVLLSFCNVAHIDLAQAMITKLEKIQAKYPVEKAKGVPTKYTKL